MTDLVERLRNRDEWGWLPWWDEAADEIERLRTENADLLAAKHKHVYEPRLPQVLNGDHAGFEIEWAASGRPANERPDWPLPSFDVRDWAAAFCRLNPGMDEELMITWFANALMRGFDEGYSRHGEAR